jgi:hypothetical protein
MTPREKVAQKLGWARKRLELVEEDLKKDNWGQVSYDALQARDICDEMFELTYRMAWPKKEGGD